MPFDEEELDPHGECAAEIHRLERRIERLRAALIKIASLEVTGGAAANLAEEAAYQQKEDGK